MQNNNRSKIQRSNLGLKVEESSRYWFLSELSVVFLTSIFKTVAVHCRLLIRHFMHLLICYSSGLTGGHTYINCYLKPSFNQVKWLLSFKWNALFKLWDILQASTYSGTPCNFLWHDCISWRDWYEEKILKTWPM